jgi:hypothetical protein
VRKKQRRIKVICGDEVDYGCGWSGTSSIKNGKLVKEKCPECGDSLLIDEKIPGDDEDEEDD